MNQLNLFSTELIEETNNTPTKPQSHPLEMLKILAEMGMQRDLIAVLLEFAEISLPLLRYYAGPLVLHRSPWSETIPDWLKTACLSDRLNLIIDEYNNGIVGDYCTSTEVVTYMMAATFEAPLHYTYSNIYIWATQDTLTRHNRLPKDYNLSENSGCSVVDFNSIKNEYHYLAKAIRNSVVRHAASQGWGKRRPSNDSSGDADSSINESQTENQVTDIQLNLF